MNIRPATEPDIDPLIKFCGAWPYQELQWQHVGFDAGALRETLSRLISGTMGECLLVVDERSGDIAGFALVFLNRYFFSREIYASDLTFYVRPLDRRGWVGVKLIRAMVAYAKRMQVRELLLTVNSGVNVDRTVKLIERLGGRRLGYSTTISILGK